MLTKNNIDKISESRGDNSTLRKLNELVNETKSDVIKESERRAAKDPEVLRFDFLNDVLDNLKEDFENETKDNPMSFNQWLDSKPDSYFQRFKYSDGGKVIDFLSYAKMKEPKIKKLDLAQGDLDRALIDIKSDSDKAMIKELLRRSGINVRKD